MLNTTILNIHLCTYFFFFFNDTATTEIYTLSLHDALPIYWPIAPIGPAGSMSAPTRSTSSDRKSTRLNSSHLGISYAVFCLKKKKKKIYVFNSRCNQLHTIK